MKSNEDYQGARGRKAKSGTVVDTLVPHSVPLL